MITYLQLFDNDRVFILRNATVSLEFPEVVTNKNNNAIIKH